MHEFVLVEARASDDVIDECAQPAERFPSGPTVFGRDRYEEPDRLTVAFDDQRFAPREEGGRLIPELSDADRSHRPRSPGRSQNPCDVDAAAYSAASQTAGALARTEVLGSNHLHHRKHEGVMNRWPLAKCSS